MKNINKIMLIIFFLIVFLLFCFGCLKYNDNDANLKNISNEDLKTVSEYFDNIVEKCNSVKLISGRVYKHYGNTNGIYIYIETTNDEFNYIKDNFSIMIPEKKYGKVYFIMKKVRDAEDEKSKNII